jgi:uncharacterized membrane protein YccC
MPPASRARDAVVPEWLVQVVRVQRTPVPWAAMVRASVAICGPLAVAFAFGLQATGLLVAMGGLLGTVVDTGGPYAVRVKRVASAALFGGATGLAIGSFIHDRAWVAVVALVVVAGASAVASAVSDIGSVSGLQLLVYSSLGLGPLGALTPWWHTAVGFVLGTVWAVVLTLPGWLLAPRAAERTSVANVYRALAGELRAVSGSDFAEVRRGATAALNAAYDSLLAARSAAVGRDHRMTHLMALLNQANVVAEAAVTLDQERNRPPQTVAETVDGLADAIRDGRRPVIANQPWGTSPGAIALRDALAGVARLCADGGVTPSIAPAVRPTIRQRVLAWRERMIGSFARTYVLRLMACVGVAAVMSEVLPLARSYWVVLTVAIVLKPDFGSVFARALQRGVGTILGAVLGAVLLAALPHGPWLLIPFGILAALLPYGRARSYGVFSALLTPLVVLLIDLLSPMGWQLALDRLLDTLLGCAIVLLVGYAPWPMSWQAHLPGQLANTIRHVGRYLQETLVPATPPSRTETAEHVGTAATGLPHRTHLRREAYRALSDLRTEFQRTMSEPATASRRASAWWPAVVGLEEVTDAVTATAVAIAGGAPAPSPEAVRQLSTTLGAVANGVDRGCPPTAAGNLPDDPALGVVTDAVRSVLTVLASAVPSDPEGKTVGQAR